MRMEKPTKSKEEEIVPLEKMTKEQLVTLALTEKVGTEEFLKELKKESLLTILTALEAKNGKLRETEELLSKVTEGKKQPKNVTTVQDLIKKKVVEVDK